MLSKKSLIYVFLCLVSFISLGAMEDMQIEMKQCMQDLRELDLNDVPEDGYISCVDVAPNGEIVCGFKNGLVSTYKIDPVTKKIDCMHQRRICDMYYVEDYNITTGFWKLFVYEEAYEYLQLPWTYIDRQ